MFQAVIGALDKSRQMKRRLTGPKMLGLLRFTSAMFAVFVIASIPPIPRVTFKADPAIPQKMARPAFPPADSVPPHFRAWLNTNPQEQPRFDALSAYLAQEGVGSVLPAWQLVQTETVDAATKCNIAGFAIPPESMWPAMVPTLRLVRDEIIPLVGPVKVLSSFRTAAANKCSAGAEGSPHRRFSALDLATLNELPQKELFAKLCKRWDQLPASMGFGLGAYYTKYQPYLNQEGRFHVDTMGRRTWGFGYGAYTSHCHELGYISVKSPAQIKAEEEAKLKAEEDVKLKLEAETKANLDLEIKAKLARKSIEKAEKERKRKAAQEAESSGKAGEFEVKVMESQSK